MARFNGSYKTLVAVYARVRIKERDSSQTGETCTNRESRQGRRQDVGHFDVRTKGDEK